MACNDRSPSVVSVGPNNVFQDFGYTPDTTTSPDQGAIGDTVFLDANNDGVFQQGEGIEGVVVSLYDATGTTKLAQTTTDENGHYYFGDLDPNNVTYVVQVQTGTLPNGGAGLTNHVDPDDASPGDSFSTWTLTPAVPSTWTRTSATSRRILAASATTSGKTSTPTASTTSRC